MSIQNNKIDPSPNNISVQNVTYSRGSKQIFKDISMEIEQGKVTAIMGPSGIGKTTLLKLIGGQITPDSGSIFFNNQDIPTLGRQPLFELRKKMSMLFQSGALFTHLSVFENVAFPIREHTLLPEELIKTLVLLKLEAVGLRGAEEMMPNELSGGMARRVALARAIALDPEVILYDEPFVGQDPITMGVLVRLIKQLNSALSVTSVVVTHDVPEVMTIADFVYLIADGRVIASGTPEQIAHHDSPQVQQFLNGEADGPVPFRYPASSMRQELNL